MKLKAISIQEAKPAVALVPLQGCRRIGGEASHERNGANVLEGGAQPADAVKLMLRHDSWLQNISAPNVLQLSKSPDLSPVLNQRIRCWDEPWVNASGTT